MFPANYFGPMAPATVEVVEADPFVSSILASLAGSTMVVVSPVGQGAVTIVQGGAYANAYGNPLDFATPTNAGWAADFTGWTNITFAATKSPYNVNTGSASASYTMSVPVASGSTQKLRLELTSAQTAALAVGQGTKGYTFRITGNPPSSTGTVVLLEGLLTVNP